MSYQPETFESRIYEFWEKNHCFDAADVSGPGQEAYAIVIPPPNVTGVLHMGHALTNTIQDTLIRWRRMKGDNTLWLPGTDHAGIATQAQVEKQIAKEGKGPTGKPLTRHDLGRDAFVARVWKWKDEHGTAITRQLRRLGSSLDWRRERFTMDEGLSKAVREVFVRLYEQGLIYRGERIINWCPRCQTALSDLEVIPTDRKGFFWHISYAVVDENKTPVLKADGSPEFLTIATTRPETLLGDSAVAVHPEDDRYKHLHGKKVLLPLLGRMIPIILDTYVDKEFGSGALKVTPSHDFNDYELGKRHELAMISVMGKDGKITAAGGPFVGLKFSEARERVVQELKEKGLLIKTEDHAHKVGLCQRCDQVAEPMISKQWFVKIEPLAKPAIQAVETGKITFTPKSWEKTYFEWMYNIRDWCISRQLWWGHQIPAWYCNRCQEITVSRETPKACNSCQAPGKELKQDEDVLDTWFSSALWPFSTLGWPEKTPALKTFYPTAVLETGFDIIFFWVARMIMMGIHFMDEVPFKKVYLHAMVRDEKGEKMSKSKGNVIDPLDLIEKHGADPLRFTLLSMAGQGRDIKLSVDRVEGYRAFCNKIFNAFKFLEMFRESCSGSTEGFFAKGVQNLEPQNRWILSRLQRVTQEVEQGLVKFELNTSAQALYEFAWHEVCDWFIELSKTPLREGGARGKESFAVLSHVLRQMLHLMHPLMPFVTEELWQSLEAKDGRTGSILMKQPFPIANTTWISEEAEREVGHIKTVIESIRNFRGETNLSPKIELKVGVRAAGAQSETGLKLLKNQGPLIQNMARVSEFVVQGDQKPAGPQAIISLPGLGLEFAIALAGLINVEEEVKRIEKEIAKVKGDMEHISRKLSQETFMSRAPAELVAKERARLDELSQKHRDLENAQKRLVQV